MKIQIIALLTIICYSPLWSQQDFWSPTNEPNSINIYNSNNGNVGIGVPVPLTKLHVSPVFLLSNIKPVSQNSILPPRISIPQIDLPIEGQIDLGQEEIPDNLEQIYLTRINDSKAVFRLSAMSVEENNIPTGSYNTNDFFNGTASISVNANHLESFRQLTISTESPDMPIVFTNNHHTSLTLAPNGDVSFGKMVNIQRAYGSQMSLNGSNGRKSIILEGSGNQDTKGGGLISLKDINDRVNIDLRAQRTPENQSAAITLNNQGNERISLLANGSNGGGVISLTDENNRKNISILSQMSPVYKGGRISINYKGDSRIIMYANGQNSDLGGVINLLDGKGKVNIRLRGQSTSDIEAAELSLRDQGEERISMKAQNGTTTHGGIISIKNREGIPTVSLIGDYGNSSGRVVTSVLQITGGSDLAEPFEMRAEVEAGMVVCIDDLNSGKLKMSEEPYDKKVAGIVSGANGINTGISLSQAGSLDNGQMVALSGRVYVKANTSNGIITPGDLLTTSSINGEAMKVTDYEKSHGAILGKAMSELSEKNGFVLVLVTLQ